MIDEEVFQVATSLDSVKIRVDRPLSPRLQANTVAQSRLTELIKQRGSIQSRLKLFQKYLSKFQNDTIELTATHIAEIDLRMQCQTVIFENFNKVQDEIEQSSKESDLLFQLEYREAFEAQYFSLMAAAKCINVSEQRQVSFGSGKPVSIKLPEIKLPAFDGSYDHWLEYRNLYLTMIHNREDLDSIQKFHYLKSSLSGTASHVISALEFTAPNYAHAWDLLESRFHNNRLLVQNHVKSLFATHSLQTESPAQIRKLIDSTLRNLRALQSLNEPTDSWDTLIIYLVVSKLDPSTEREWETHKGLLVTKKFDVATDANNRITLDDLIVFLRNRADMLDMIKPNSNKRTASCPHTASSRSNPTQQLCYSSTSHYDSKSNPLLLTHSYASQKPVSDNNTQKRSCVLCGNDHFLYSCAKFLNMSVENRYQFIQNKKVCQNCFRSNNHSSNECSFGPCKLCQAKHNTLLHNNNIRSNEGLGTDASTHTSLPIPSLHQSADTQVGTERNVLTCHAAVQPVLLSTALIDVPDSNNRLHTVRALLDSGSQSCFITESLVNRFRLPIIQSTLHISGVGQNLSQSAHTCRTIIRSKISDFHTEIQCLVLPCITTKLPSLAVNCEGIRIPSHISLADPTFSISSDVDMLLGADIFWDLLGDAKIKLSSGPHLTESKLGWIISGPIRCNYSFNIDRVQCNLVQVNSQLRGCWESEELTVKESSYSLGESFATMPNDRCMAVENNSNSSLQYKQVIVKEPYHLSIRIPQSCAHFLLHSSNIARKAALSCCSRGSRTGLISGEAFERSLTMLTRAVHHQSLCNEYPNHKICLPLLNLKYCKTLNLNGIICVGGRLCNATNFRFNQIKNPVLCCGKYRFDRLLYAHEHGRLFHAVSQFLVYSMRERWWVFHIRMLIVNFEGKGAQIIKFDVCLFICFTIRATQDFLITLNTLISHRSKPQILLNNLNNFVFNFQSIIFKYFNFNNNYIYHIRLIRSSLFSPYFGGLWEAGVRSCKYWSGCLLGNTVLTCEEIGTVQTQIETVPISRTLSPLSSDTNLTTESGAFPDRPTVSFNLREPYDGHPFTTGVLLPDGAIPTAPVWHRSPNLLVPTYRVSAALQRARTRGRQERRHPRQPTENVKPVSSSSSSPSCWKHFYLVLPRRPALASSGEGTRSLIFVGESAVTASTLANIEALRCAQSTHAIPTKMLPSVQTQHMMENIKKNLGIVICLDKQQSNLSDLMEKYPMLYNDAHFVWLDRWSDNTLREMPTLVIQRLMKENVSEITKEQFDLIPTDGFVKIYNSLNSELLKAPCRYVNFIKSYCNIVNRKKTTLFQRQSMLSSGVLALRRARSEVATLQAEAAQQESLLSEKQDKANSALDQISATVRANTDKKEEMHALKMNIESENQKLQVQKKEIEAELASVEPVIAAARAAVGDLRPESLSEVRSLRAPPDVVRDVLEGVLRLMGIADTSWSAMKNFLSKRGVKEDIRCLDASQISSTALQNVQRLLEKRGASFEASTAKRASAACAPLAAWVRANVEYACALQRVQPLQAHQARLHTNLQEAEDQLTALSSGLASVDQRVSALKEQLGQHTRDAAAIEMRLNAAADTLRAAQNLLDQLAHEYTAWECDLENILKEISELNQRSLLAAAYIVYLSDLTEPQAREYIKVWGNLIGFKDASFSVINFLSSTEKQLKWDADGLPSDQSAVKNAVLIDQVLQTPRCGFTPLLIDPDGEGLLWLRNSLEGVPCDFVSQHSEKLLTAVQYAVRLGRVLVITDVDEVHDSWSLLLSGLAASTAGAGTLPPRLVLQCRDATLTRRLAAHCSARLAPTHFTPRLDGLTDQLIHYALQQQNPEISGKAKEIKMQKAKLQKEQYELQENLLRDLSSNSDILHDANLLASLNKTRETNTTISKALEAAREIERANSEACAKYEPSAKRAAMLALAVKRLSARWPLVVLPVDAVLEVFVEAVRKADNTNINHEEIVKYLTRRIVERVLLALHKKDKYIVVMYLLKQVYEDLMPDKIWQLFIGTSVLNEENLNTSEIKKNHPWLPDVCLKATAKLKATDEDLYNRLSLQNTELWKQFLSSGDLNVLSKLRLSPFETVACVAAVRPDSLYRAIVTFVDFILGAGCVLSNAPVRSAARCARSRPVLLLAAHAADVLAAHAHAHQHTLLQVDVEQGLVAWRSALETARGGAWLVVSVAASPFTRDLQAFIVEVAQSTEHFNEEFRMWIVSEYRDIPPLVSNACVNVILEAPEGVKNNVMGTLSAWGNYEADPKVVQLHANLAFFHALVQERRAYIPQGWSRWYSWEWGEVWASAQCVRAGGAALCLPLYAARVQDAADARVLRVLHARHLTRALCPVPLPAASTLQAYASAFSALPDIDTPQLLGLPANCRVAWEKNAADNIITVLKELNSTVSANEKSDGVASLMALLGLWKKNMSGCRLVKAGRAVQGGGAGWWGCVVGGELDAAGRGARALHAGLGQLARSLAHSHSHALHEVPEEWQLIWAGPSAADAYVREFSHRARAAVTRSDTEPGRVGYMPTEVDLRCLLEPSRAVWALRAHSLARLRAAPDHLALVASWGSPVEAGDGMVVLGLRLCGAVVTGGGLSAAPPHAPPHAPAPSMTLRFTAQSKESGLDDGSLELPVYSTESRENLLFSVRAPLSRDFPRDSALLNAVALFVAPLD